MNKINPSSNSFWLFIGVLLIGILLGCLISGVLLLPYLKEMSLGMNMLNLPRKTLISVQIVQMICFFIVPPVLYALFSKKEISTFFLLNKPIKVQQYLLATGIAFVLFPLLINVQYVCMHIPLPDSIRIMADAQRELNTKMISLFLNYPGISNLILMILMIGVGAGLTEELFFRGFLLHFIKNWFRSVWVAIVLSGFIFSLFHANAYDFIPIWMVGIILGFIYTKTGDLKLNIYLHAIYNSFQVILTYMYNNKWISGNIENVEKVPIFVWICCLFAAIFFIKTIVQNHADISD